MANKFQTKRTTISGRTPNTTNSGNTHYIDTGELALNLTDGKMFSSNGSAYFEVGANLANQTVSGTANVGKLNVTASSGDEGGEIFLAAPVNTTLAGGITIDAYQNKIRFFEQGGNARGAFIDLTACANGAGTNLLTGGSGGSGTVTQVNTGIGLSGGPITATGTISVVANNGIVSNSTGVFANAGTGIVANATGIHVNSSYIATISANNTSFLGGTAAGSYVQNTDSRTLSGNLVISGTYFNPSANTILLGNSTQRWVLSANTADFTGTVSGTIANMSTSVNSALLTVGTSFIANTIGAYHTGLVNAASHTTSGFVANTTAIAPTSNTILLGNTIGRFVLSANTIDASGLITGSAGATITGQVNASTGFGSGTINATSNGLIANSSTVTVGNSTVNVAITTAGITSSGGTGVNPSSNTVGTALGTTTQRWVISANTINASGLITAAAGANIQGTANLVDVNISGNLTVSGTTTYINTTNLNVGDNIVTLNADLPGATAPTENAGLEINRGSAANVSFLWNETSDSWTAGNTDITGYANASVSVNSALLSVGSSFIANTTGAYHTGTVNAASHTVGSSFIANSIAIVGTGYANVTTSVNSALLTVGTSFIANTTGAYHTGVVNAATLSTGTINATSNGIIANTTIITFGNSSVNVSINTSSVNVATHLSGVINATSNGFSANATTITVGNTSVNVVITPSTIDLGTQFDANLTGLYHTGTVNAASHTVGTNFIANSTAIVGTGYANITTSVNSASLTVGTSFIANSTQLTLTGIPLSANGTTGTAGQVLASNGTTGSPYWTTASGGGTVTQVSTGNGLTGGPITTTGTISVVANNGIISNSTGVFVNAANGLLSNATGVYVQPGNGIESNSTGVHVKLQSSIYGLVANSNGLRVAAGAGITVTSVVAVDGGNGIAVFAANGVSVRANNGIIANSTGTFVNPGTGIVANTTGVHVNSSYIATISANDSSFLGGTAAAAYVQNTDSRTLSGNLVISGTSFTPSANTVLLGNSTQRWVLSANTGDFTGTVSGIVANMSTSVNSALLTVGTSFIANTTGAYHTGLVNAASINIGGSGFIANSTAIVLAEPVTANATTGTAGQALLSNGTVGSPYWGTPTSSPGATYVQNTDSRTLSGNLVISGTSFTPSSNTILLGNSTQRWVISANTIDASGTVTAASFSGPGTGLTGTASSLSIGGSAATLTTARTFTLGGTSKSFNGSADVTWTRNEILGSPPNSGAFFSNTPPIVAADGVMEIGRFIDFHSNNTTTADYDVRVESTGSSAMSFNGATIAAGNTTITGFANVSTSVNSASFTTTGFVANTTAIAPTSNTILLGNSIGRFVLSANTIDATGQITSTRAGSTADGNGQIYLSGATSNRIDWAATGLGAPAVTTRSSGTKLVLYPAVAAAAVDYGIGVETNHLWISAADSGGGIKWYANTTQLAVANTSGITVGSGGIFPTSNSSATSLGSATQRWVLNANTGSFAGAVSGITTLAAGNTTITGFANVTSTIQGGSSLTIAGALSGVTTAAMGNTTITGFANASVSVNSALLTVGTSFIANTTGAYHTGLVNAASHTTSGFVANTTVIAPTSNTILLGNTIGRFVVSANTIDTSGLITGGAGATITGQVNASTGFGSGTINATSNGLFANSTTISLGNSSVNVAITTAGITSSGGTGINPSSNTVGTTLGTTTQRWVVNANTGSFAGDVTISSSTASGNNSTGALKVTGGVGVGDSVYVKNRVGFTNSTNISVVYQVYNVTTNSLDTVFG